MKKLGLDTSQISLIDLAILLPKNDNFYADKMHHTEEGLENISDIVANYFIDNCELIFEKNICKQNYYD